VRHSAASHRISATPPSEIQTRSHRCEPLLAVEGFSKMRRTFSKLHGSRRKPAGTLLRPSDVSGTCFRDAMFAIAGQILCIRPIVAQTPLDACISDKGDVVNLAQLTALAPQICHHFSQSQQVHAVQDLYRIDLLPSRHHVRFENTSFCCTARLSLSYTRTASVLLQLAACSCFSAAAPD
jgi:hypothetical protein